MSVWLVGEFACGLSWGRLALHQVPGSSRGVSKQAATCLLHRVLSSSSAPSSAPSACLVFLLLGTLPGSSSSVSSSHFSLLCCSFFSSFVWSFFSAQLRLISEMLAPPPVMSLPVHTASSTLATWLIDEQWFNFFATSRPIFPNKCVTWCVNTLFNLPVMLRVQGDNFYIREQQKYRNIYPLTWSDNSNGPHSNLKN